MAAILLIEGDPLTREIVRDRLDVLGHAVCAVGTARAGLGAARCMRFELVILGAAAAAGASVEQRDAIAALGVPVLAPDAAGREETGVAFGAASLAERVRRTLPPPAPMAYAGEATRSNAAAEPALVSGRFAVVNAHESSSLVGSTRDGGTRGEASGLAWLRRVGARRH